MLLAMLCGNLPFSGNSPSEIIEKITKVDYSIPAHIKNVLSYDVRDLLRKILVAEPS